MRYIKKIILMVAALTCSICFSLAAPHSKYSKHSALPKEKTGFRLYGDFMLTADLADSAGMKKPALGLALTPGAQISNYFFLGGKVGAMYMIDDCFAFPLAVNVRWTFGRKNILTISQSGGVAYCEDKLYPYIDYYFGGRIPLREGKSIVCALGYVIFPQYNTAKITNEETGESREERQLSSWIAPQLTIAYPFRFEKKNRVRYRVHHSKPKISEQSQCRGRTSKSSKNQPSVSPKEMIEGEKQRPERTNVQHWNP